jgi:hypothetical protein
MSDFLKALTKEASLLMIRMAVAVKTRKRRANWKVFPSLIPRISATFSET